MRGPPSTQMTARAPIACARISLATCAILLACAARRVKRIACVRYSSCMSRFIVCRVACCAVLSYGDALRWLCGAVGCAWSGGYLSLFVVRRGAVWWSGAAWCCPVCRFAPLVLVYCLRLQLCASCSATVSPVILRSLAAACHPVGFHPLPFRARLFRLRRARSAYLAIHITIVAFIII